MKIFFDTEFIEDGKTIDLISIGMVKEDGSSYYAISSEFDASKANDWVKENVLSKIKGEPTISRAQIAAEIIAFAGEDPQFWAYHAAYDWVVLCQLYGTMIELPEGWDTFCMDLKQSLVMIGDPEIEKLPEENAHSAFVDALWLKNTYDKYFKLDFSSI